MKDIQGNLVLGRTRWRRFAVVFVPALAVVGGLLFGVSAGAFHAQFTVSGQLFKVSADELRGDGFRQFPSWDEKSDDTRLPVARSVIESADLDNLCQSVAIPEDAIGALFPGIDSIVLRIEAGGDGEPATASNLVIGLTELSGDATFTNIQIGNDAGELSGESFLDMQFGQRADRIVIEDLRQTAYSTSAGTFTLNDLSLRVLVDSEMPNNGECF